MGIINIAKRGAPQVIQRRSPVAALPVGRAKTFEVTEESQVWEIPEGTRLLRLSCTTDLFYLFGTDANVEADDTGDLLPAGSLELVPIIPGWTHIAFIAGPPEDE